MTSAMPVPHLKTLEKTFHQILGGQPKEKTPEAITAAVDSVVEQSRSAFEGWARAALRNLVRKWWPKPASLHQGYLFSEAEWERNLVLPKGEKVKITDATLSQLKASLRALVGSTKKAALAKADVTLEKRQQLINEMTPFALRYHTRETPFTVKDYLECRARGEAPPPVKRDRSATLKRIWADRATEREATARKRGRRAGK